MGNITAVGQLLQLATIFGRLFQVFKHIKHTSRTYRLKNEARARVDLVSSHRVIHIHTLCTASLVSLPHSPLILFQG